MTVVEPPQHSPNCPPPVAQPTVPSLEIPSHAVDSHCHVFGPHDRFPFAADRTFTPVDVPLERLRALHDLLGFDRAVIVQSACHGSDHSALLDALRTSPGRYRGVALVRPDTPRDTVAGWDEAGVRGTRLNFLSHLGGAPSDEVVEAVVRLVKPHGWHVSVHVAGTGITDYADRIDSIEAPVVIDHMARVDLSEGVDGPAVRSLLGLLDAGNVWVKLSGADRLSGGPVPSDAALALARRLATHAPDRVVWGTDFPHPNITAGPPDDGTLVDSIGIVAPEPELRQRLLVENPAALFGF